MKAGSLAAMKRAFEAAHKARFGFIDRTKQIVVEAVSVEAVGGGAKFKERASRRRRAHTVRRDADGPVFLQAALARRRGLYSAN